MSPFLNIPQTPRLKERLEDDDEDDIIDRLPSFDEAGNRKNQSLLDPNVLRSATTSPFSQDGRLSPALLRTLSPSPSHHSHPLTRRAAMTQTLNQFWMRYRAVILVAFSQFFAAIMNLTARILELEGEGMHPFQILFARMSITTVLSCIYMYYTKVPHFPFGAKEVRGLLVLRGISGFFGIYPFWLSIMYLPLAEATVIAFLAPTVAGYICHLVIKTPFTRREQLASLVALAGVILIARPTSLFNTSPPGDSVAAPPEAAGNTTTQHRHSVEDATPAERLLGIGQGLVGVLGAGVAFFAIRCIGTRAHALISVNYFSVWCSIVSVTALTFAPMLNIGQPEIRFGVPSSPYLWMVLISLGLSGFIMQFMLTSGLGKEGSNRANAMIYTHMLFAAGFDRFIFGHQMGFVSIVGCGLIIGSALWVALSKKEEHGKAEGGMEETAGGGGGVESVPMLRRDNVESEDEEEEGIPLGRVR